MLEPASKQGTASDSVPTHADLSSALSAIFYLMPNVNLTCQLCPALSCSFLILCLPRPFFCFVFLYSFLSHFSFWFFHRIQAGLIGVLRVPAAKCGIISSSPDHISLGPSFYCYLLNLFVQLFIYFTAWPQFLLHIHHIHHRLCSHPQSFPLLMFSKGLHSLLCCF